VVSGEVALLLQRYPSATPDQVKRQLMSTASAFSSTTNIYRGNGTTDVRTAETRSLNTSTQSPQFYGTGTGKIELARGSSHVDDGYGAISGEVDVFGRPWNGAAWAKSTSNVTAWNGGAWLGATLTGSAWSSGAWPTATWSLSDWNAKMWRSADWDAKMWRDGSWSDAGWA
jgi:serine protease AprX